MSVVFAVRNEQEYVQSAVLSVLDQQGLELEVVVVDDGSTDGTFGLLEQLAAGQNRVRLVRNPGTGKCSAFNYGVSLATGRFTCIFAGDDLMPQGSLAARFEAVRALPEDKPVVGLCKIISMAEDPKFDKVIVPRKRGRGALSGVSPLMNQRSLHLMFPVPVDLPNEDTWMELAVQHLSGWIVVHSDIIGCRWRVHQGNSINMLLSFPEYNRRISARMRALPLFRERFSEALSAEGRRNLDGKIACEEARIRGSVLGVLLSKADFVSRLRSLSVTNGYFYALRQRLFRLFSGW